MLFGKSFSSNVDPKLTYENHTKDVWYTKTYGYSYTTYMEQLIDNLILQPDLCMVAEVDHSHLVNETVSPTVRCRTNTAFVSLPPHIDIVTDGTYRDINDSSKNRGFLYHETANFYWPR